MKRLTLDDKKDNFLNTLNFRKQNENVDKHCSVKLVVSGDLSTVESYLLYIVIFS